MRFSKTVKEFYVIKNREGGIIKLNSGKFWWEKIGSAKNAIVQHLQKSFVYTSRDNLNKERIQEIINKGWIVQLYNPVEYHFLFEGTIYKANSLKEIREILLDTGFLKVEKIN